MTVRSSADRGRQLGRRRLGALLAMLVIAAGAVAAGIAVADHESSDVRSHGAAIPPGMNALSPQPGVQLPDTNIYSHTLAGMLSPVSRHAQYLVYAPDSQGNGVYVIDPRRYKVIRYIQTGPVVQHVVPSWDLRTLYATNDIGNSLTPIDPNTGRRAGPNIPVTDPYNLYFTPDGRHAIVVEETQQTLAFRDPHSFALQKALNVHCPGVDHMDFSADGTFAVASCEFSGQLVRIDLRSETVGGYVRVGGSPQDVKLSPDGQTFYVANRFLPNRGASGVQLIDARTLRWAGFIPTGPDAHGLYVSRDTRDLYVTARAGEQIVVIDFATRRVVAVWHVPGTPDMGNVSPDGTTLWVSSRYTSAVLVISTRTGHVIASIPAGVSPHGVCVWPQPGRYSTGHTGVMR
jgi:YVTN family beta-propeller protein